MRKKLVFEHTINKNLNELFPFFSDARNLEKITPPWLQFRVIGMSTDEIQQGTFIDYRLKIHGIPISWRSEILKWDPPHSFVDQQVRGPYRYWHHLHRFEPLDGGTRMVDEVTFEVPLGALGYLFMGRFVQKDIEKIFQFRKEKINEIFA